MLRMDDTFLHFKVTQKEDWKGFCIWRDKESTWNAFGLHCMLCKASSAELGHLRQGV